MNFLFVIPRFATKGNYYNYPIGIASVYSYMKQQGFAVFCLNLCHTDETVVSAMQEVMAAHAIDVVCTGGVSLRWVQINEILVAAKAVSPRVITVVGGPIVTAETALAMQNMSIDVAVMGEGEISMAELAAALEAGSDLATVKGIAYCPVQGELLITGEREPIADLDILPIMEFEEFGFGEWLPLIKYAQQMTILETFPEVRHAEIVGSRSCPFGCTFCYHPLGNKYRQRSLNHIFAEVDYLTETFGVKTINFFDDLFSVNHERMYEFSARLKKYDIKWMAQFRVNDVTHELLTTMKESGLIHMSFGVESLCDSVLQSMKKKTTSREIENAFVAARQAKVYCSGNIILGDPADTKETVAQSISWWKQHNLYNVSLNFILAVPDAPVYRYAVEKGIIKDKLLHIRSKFPLVNFSQLSDKDYYRLVFTISFWKNTHKYMAPGQLLASRRLTEQYRGKNFYELTVTCPFCKETNTYKKFISSQFQYAQVLCSACLATCKIPQKVAFPAEYSTIKMLLSVCWALFQDYCVRFSLLRNNRHKVKQLLSRIAAVVR